MVIKRNVTMNGTTKAVHLGWERQMPDPRDEHYRLKLHRAMLAASQPRFDNREICSPVEDQADLGSCTANAFAALIEANELRGGTPMLAGPSVSVSTPTMTTDGSIVFTTTVKPSAAPARTLVDVSRLLHYYATRRLMGMTGQDSGASFRNTIRAGVVYGVADEKLWPYNPAQFTVNPPDAVWIEAARHKVTSYHAIANADLETMKATLCSRFLVGFGFAVYDAMLSADVASKGILCRPAAGEQLQGGHAVALVGYDDAMPMPDGSRGAFLVRNSWGPKWGLGGYFWMAYNYVADPRLAADFWVVQSSPL